MFRIVVKKTLLQKTLPAAAISRACLSSTASAPASSVKDLLIDLTFVDPSGARRKVTGIIGTYFPLWH